MEDFGHMEQEHMGKEETSPVKVENNANLESIILKAEPKEEDTEVENTSKVEIKEEEEDDRFETISIDDSSSIFDGNNDKDPADKDECEKDGEAVEVKESVEEMCEVISQDALDDVEDISDDDEVQYIDEEIVDEQPVDQIISTDHASRTAAADKFETISDGSIDKMEQDEIIEMDDDGEDKNISETEPSNSQDDKLRNEPESLEEVFFATENANNTDEVILVEDKDNDEISDASLVDDQLSLEEISDDDLDTSRVKKRRKSGLQTPEKKSAEADKDKDDVKIDATTEPKKDDDVKDEKSRKRSLSEKADSTEKENVKKKKVEDKDDDADKVNTDKSAIGGDNEPAFYTGVVGTKAKPKVAPLDLPTSQSTKLPKKQKTISPLERQKSLPGDKNYRRKSTRSPHFTETGCQTERTNMKGKIVQCSINPLSSLSGKPVKHIDSSTSDSRMTSALYHQYKSLIPSSISGEMFSAITSASLPVQGQLGF